MGEKREYQHKILCVDDEENILNSIRRLFRREGYEILTASSGSEGLRLLEEIGPVTLVISDQRMPEMTGVEFLNRIRRIYPDTIRIMLTGYADIKSAVEAINKGEVYRFISKPWNDEEIRVTVREAVRNYELVKEIEYLNRITRDQNLELKELNQNLEKKVAERTREVLDKSKELERLYQELEKNFYDFIRVFIGILELRNPYLGGRSKRVAVLARKLGERFGMQDDNLLNIEVAALLQDIGTLGFPESILTKKESDLNSSELVILEQHPYLSENALQHIERLEPVRKLIRHHHERYDGNGYPDGLTRDEIPLGSRIIAVAGYYDSIINPIDPNERVPPDRVIHHLQRERGTRLDPLVVNRFIDFIQSLRHEHEEELSISIEELQEGMVLARNIYTKSGLLLLAKGEVLKDAQLERIQNFHQIDPIIDKIYVYKRGQGAGVRE